MANGSNNLNFLLKARLDVTGSLPDLRKQVDEISERLKNKPVKLKVQLDGLIKDIKPQITALSLKLANNPVKLRVDVDIRGAIGKIRSELKDVHKIVDDFNSKYSKQLADMKEKTSKVYSGGDKDAPLGNFNVQQYVKQVSEAEKEMRKVFGEGIFRTDELKTANGELVAFTAQLSKADGVVQKLRYNWDSKTGSFQVVDQKTINETQKYLDKSVRGLRELEREIIRTGNQSEHFWKEYDRLSKLATSGTLTQQQVADLQRRIKDEQSLQKVTSEQNQQYIRQERLIEKINQSMKERKSLENSSQYGGLLNQARLTQDKDTLERINLEVDKLIRKHKEEENEIRDKIRLNKERLKVVRELRRMEETTPTMTQHGNIRRQQVTDIRLLAERISSEKELNSILAKRDDIQQGRWIDNAQGKARKSMADLKILGGELKRRFGETSETYQVFANEMRRLEYDSSGHMRKFLNVKDVESQLIRYNQVLKKRKNDIEHTSRELAKGIDISRKLGTGNLNELHGLMFGAGTRDTNAIQQYIGRMERAKVATLSFAKDSVDEAGRRMRNFNVTFDSTGKTARQVFYTMSEDGKIFNQVQEKMVFNANRNLGMFEQLRIAMARVPIWMTAMTAFYGTIRSVQAMTREILAVDTALTELRRVADEGIHVDTLFRGAVALSGELGNNVHEVLDALSGFTRTFGEFNEAQLLAITRTATLMANVSDLTANEAMDNLVGTMKAFNIEAEDSVRIVDALNEVDNNYAVSTQQLSEGLAKSASTAETFGVTMEENIGHITAISGVTAESGRIIGKDIAV